MIFNMKALIYFSFHIVFLSCVNDNTKKENNQLPEISTLESPSGITASLPHLVTGNDGKLYLSWVETNGDTTVLKYASRQDTGWSTAKEISKGTNWFVNWADYPMIAVNENSNMIAHFMAKSSDGFFSYDVNIVRKSASGGWSTPLVPHNDGTPTEHGFVTMLPIADGAFQLGWLDGRNTSSESNKHKGAMTMRTAVLNMDGTLSDEVELDNRTCDCCQTGGAITDNGPILVYRDRSENEERDIAIVRLVNGSWTPSNIIYEDNWEIAGCPVNGPRADAIGNNLGIAWFAAPDNKPEIKVIFSKDGGEMFGDPITIDNKYPIGRVDLVMLDKDRAMVSWLCKEGGETLIKAQVVHQSGLVEPSIVIAESQEVRGSGFPQMSKYNEDVYFAWTNLIEEQESQVKTAILSNHF